MSWLTYRDMRGETWSVNQIGLWILVRQNVYNRLLLQRSRVKRETRLLLPDLVSVETDFEGIGTARDREATPLWVDIEQRVANDPAGSLPMLVQMRQETERCAGELVAMQRSASQETFANIERSVSRGEAGAAIAGGIRDLSATTLVVGSAFLTGGAAIAVLGGGSVLKGTGRYQETGNVGGAILEATGTFVVGAIPLVGGTLRGGASVATSVGGEAIRYGERVALIVVGATLDAQIEGSKALIDGASARDALRAASARFTIDIVTGGFGTMLDSRAMPVAIRLVTDSVASFGGDQVVRAATARSPLRARVARMPEPTAAAVCDANAVLSTGGCDAAEWVRQIALHRGQ